MWVTCAVALFVAVLAAVILAGKGDMLIAGYNTASAEERRRVNVKRLRLLVGSLLLVVAAMCVLKAFGLVAQSVPLLVLIPLCIVTLILANTWAVKR